MTLPSSQALTTLRLDTLWHRLLAVVEEQAQLLMRAAFSPVVREAGDLSAGVFDASGRMLAQAETGTPGHVNCMAQAARHFLDRFPLASMQAGDAYATNDPWLASGHLHDITVVSPIVHRGVPVGLTAVTIHLTDVGGRGQGPDAHSVFEEGIRLPPMPLVRAGTRDDAVLTLLAANVRRPVEFLGDLESCFAACASGARRVAAKLAEFDQQGLAAVAAHIVDRSAAAMRAALAAWPQGSWNAEMLTDGYDAPLRLACRLTLDDTGARVDFAGTDAVQPRGINVPLVYAAAYACFALRCAVAPAVPNNAGSLAAIRVVAPEGCVLNPGDPAPVSARHVVGLFIPDLVFACLDQARKGVVPAESAGPLWTVRLSGEGWTGSFSVAGGTGARPGRHGLSGRGFPSGARAVPVEVIEASMPVVLSRKELRAASGSEGTWRGGDGQVVEIASARGEAMVLNAMFDRLRHATRGRAGGGDGAMGVVGHDGACALSTKGRQRIAASKRLILCVPGGGYGGSSGDSGSNDSTRASVR
jgi:N-methylhydantoinase B